MAIVSHPFPYSSDLDMYFKRIVVQHINAFPVDESEEFLSEYTKLVQRQVLVDFLERIYDGDKRAIMLTVQKAVLSKKLPKNDNAFTIVELIHIFQERGFIMNRILASVTEEDFVDASSLRKALEGTENSEVDVND